MKNNSLTKPDDDDDLHPQSSERTTTSFCSSPLPFRLLKLMILPQVLASPCDLVKSAATVRLNVVMTGFGTMATMRRPERGRIAK
ncbi:hypothetical protein CEXT_706701 [Caerostris extrusa]|uniref:Uncharacterized protein n=1 Tax=Caerostris extrusa TaxID=172846 RepID=A0AAV4PX14_CAEEX|nr:hypothetical protein CEXT_706701 [Caerostris extrusa]